MVLWSHLLLYVLFHGESVNESSVGWEMGKVCDKHINHHPFDFISHDNGIDMIMTIIKVG